MIFEYTDVEDYQEAITLAINRETKHVDPFTGKINGNGGILALKKIFPDNKIVSFRAPQYCWTPTPLEALKKFGFKFDFSANICKTPIYYEGITFYPYPLHIDGIFGKIGFRALQSIGNRATKGRVGALLSQILREKMSIISLHPHRLMFSKWWNINSRTPSRNSILRKIDISMFELLLFQLNVLNKMRIIKTNFNLTKSKIILDPKKIDVKKISI